MTRLAGATIRQARARVWLLRGPLGSGKTTFVRGALRALGHRGRVASPTFTLSQSYNLRHQRWVRVVHIDAYRLRSVREEAALDITSAVSDPGCLLIIEWPEKLSRRSWPNVQRVRFGFLPHGRRVVFSRAG